MKGALFAGKALADHLHLLLREIPILFLLQTPRTFVSLFTHTAADAEKRRTEVDRIVRI